MNLGGLIDQDYFDNILVGEEVELWHKAYAVNLARGGWFQIVETLSSREHVPSDTNLNRFINGMIKNEDAANEYFDCIAQDVRSNRFRSAIDCLSRLDLDLSDLFRVGSSSSNKGN